jgi:hypothetical protein
MVRMKRVRRWISCGFILAEDGGVVVVSDGEGVREV